jgi:hypothetical protein
MLQGIRRRAGSPALIVAVIALVVALAGSAYAAKKYVITSTSQIKPSVLKSLQGKAGANGANGTNGAPGAKGDKGDQGAPGKDGQNGTPGKSIVMTPIPTGEAECAEQGGSKLEREGEPTSETFICNGEKGVQGEPWTPNSVLPPGATETGGWSFNGTAADTEGLYALVSFPIQSKFAFSEAHVHYIAEGETAPVACEGKNALGEILPGNVNFPRARPGELCVYESATAQGSVESTFDGIYNLQGLGTKGASRSGALIHFKEITGVAFGSGSWAVTGCEAETAFPCP